MTPRVLYLAPYPPARSGIADYAARFREAIESTSAWRFTVESFEGIRGNSFADVERVRSVVDGWRREGLLDDTALVHAELGCHQHAVFQALTALRRLSPRMPTCITVHDPPLIVAPALYPLALGRDAKLVRRALRLFDYTPMGKRLLRRPLRNASQLFALTRAGACSLRRETDDRVPVEYLPHIGLGSLSPPRKKHADASTSAPLRILSIGFWGPRTGIPVLLEALRRLIESGSGGVRLLLAGAPDDSSSGRDFATAIASAIESSPARPYVDQLGFVPASDLEALFRSADIFVLPYASVPALSASGVVFRAAAAGLPVVASDLDTIREHVVNGRTGLVVPRGDADALARALELLASDPDIRYRLGRALQSHVRRRHGAAAIASTVLPVYERLAELRRSS